MIVSSLAFGLQCLEGDCHLHLHTDTMEFGRRVSTFQNTLLLSFRVDIAFQMTAILVPGTARTSHAIKCLKCLDSSFESSISTEWCSNIIEGNKQPVPGYSPGYVDIIHYIHFYAARMHQKAYEERCIALLKKYPHAINTPRPSAMYTPFLRACLCGNATAISFMLKNGADITSHTKEGDTPMYLAVYSITKQPQVFDPICINILYNAGCDINTPKNHGYTPLHLAAKAGNADLVRWLLLRGADPDSVTKCNKKPVDFAKKYGMAFK
ncbi:hypothetical protein Cfor_04444 [Coptotermes formosanus]|uniref:Uncharacterized protein n=1 Tax=Coptotermes formosanus TaxID=36987 RepID=A0A6L2PFN7_COPFO|nr:hypothetical protein Cfor_04444 [Coptotermes formosanus]